MSMCNNQLSMSAWSIASKDGWIKRFSDLICTSTSHMHSLAWLLEIQARFNNAAQKRIYFAYFTVCIRMYAMFVVKCTENLMYNIGMKLESKDPYLLFNTLRSMVGFWRKTAWKCYSNLLFSVYWIAYSVQNVGYLSMNGVDIGHDRCLHLHVEHCPQSYEWTPNLTCFRMRIFKVLFWASIAHLSSHTFV